MAENCRSVITCLSLAGSSAGKKIREQFPDNITVQRTSRAIPMKDEIRRLLKVRWWDWDDCRIEKALPMLLNGDIGVFLDAAEKKEI